MTQTAANQNPDIDRIAIVMSALCIVHCLALPVVLIALPFVAQFASTHWHLPMLLFAVPVSVTAIVIGYRRHGNFGLLAGAALGLALLIGGATLGHNYLGPAADRSLTIAGSLILAFVHWQNSRLLRSCTLRGDTALADS
ncbi:MAG: MerC domain-containing protein [Woeseia sp.]|nr:MerC domain-containing protein [Woeseia sp.]